MQLGNTLLLPEDKVENKTHKCEGNAGSRQDGEDDSEGDSHCHLLLKVNSIIWDYTTWGVRLDEYGRRIQM